jgi:hypothetical protein
VLSPSKSPSGEFLTDVYVRFNLSDFLFLIHIAPEISG